MNEAFFFCQKSYGNTTRFNFFSTDFFLSVRAPGIFGPTDQKIFQYDRRPCYMIRSDRKNLIFDKSLMGTKLESIFLSTRMYLKLQFLAQGRTQMKICSGTNEDLLIC